MTESVTEVNDQKAGVADVNDSNAFDLSSIQVEDATESESFSAPTPRKREPRAKSEKIKAPPKSKPTMPPYREGALVKPLTQLYGYAAMGLSFFDPQCGQAVMASAEQCAIQWDQLAKTNIAVRRVLQSLVETGAWTGVTVAHLPIILAIASHHGSLPPGVKELLLAQASEESDADQQT